MTTPTIATSALADQVAMLAQQVAALNSQKITYVQAPVVAVDTSGSTFTAQMPSQTDGAAVPLAGIASPPQFLPVPGSTATIALSGATPVYQPTAIAPGAITVSNLSPNAPGAPSNLALSTSTGLASDGRVTATIVATWTAPTTTVGGAALTGALTYVAQYKPTGTPAWTTHTSATTTISLPVASGVPFDVQVAAKDQLGNIGAYTPVSTITSGKDTTPPAAPTTPVVGSYLGQLKVTWDGQLTTGPVPADFSTLEVHASASNGFTPSAATLVSNMATGGSAYATAPYGTTTYVKLVAIDNTGNRSTPSGQASGATTKVVSDDILAGAVGAAQLASLSVSTANLVDAAVIQAKIGTNAVGNVQLADLAVQTSNIVDASIVTAKIADLAVNTAKIGNLAVGTAQMADLSVASAKIANAAVVNAKIGSLAVNDAQIGNVAVGKLTAGTMTADVIMSGRFCTALTGARTEVNSLGFQKFDSSGNKVISLTSTESLFSGTFQTGSSGRYITIGAGGTTGIMNFYAPNGQHAYITAYTEPQAPNYESLQMCLDMGGHYLWNAINIDNIPQIAYHSAWHEFGMTVGGQFNIGQYTNNTSFGAGLIYRMQINGAGFQYTRPGGQRPITIAENATNNAIVLAPSSGGYMELWNDAGQAGNSARLVLFQAGAIGGTMMKNYSSHMEIRQVSDTLFADIVASAFTIGSDADSKTNIQDVTLDAVGKVKALRPRSYQRKQGKDKKGNDQPPGPVEIGLIAQEAPPEILGGSTTSDGQLTINTYAYTTLVAAGLQQGLAALDALTARVDILERKGKP